VLHYFLDEPSIRIDTVLVDTGSANTWIGASKPYLPTRTSLDTGETFVSVRGPCLLFTLATCFQSLTYGDGQTVEGDEYQDTITVNPNLIIDGSYIGVAYAADLPAGVDGILGLGPATLSEGKVTNLGVIPTVLDGLYGQGQITDAKFGVFFPPASAADNTGELSFGGYDTSKISGNLNEVDITSVTPSSRYWGIEQSINYGNTMILDVAAGIIDTGTTLILIATGMHLVYLNDSE